MQIELTDTDFDRCVNITDKRQQESKAAKHQTKYDQPMNLTFEHTLQGVLGEQAVAHYFDYEYKHMPYNKNAHDILGYEVRTTYYCNGSLITHPEDKLANYILVTIDKNEMIATLKGWSPLYRCNLWQSNWQTKWRYPCFGMPEAQLWPMDTLIATPELLEHQNRLDA